MTPEASRTLVARVAVATALTVLIVGQLLMHPAQLSVTLHAQSSCGALVNPIVCENQKAGDPASQWDVSGAGDSSIQGFATKISVTPGQAETFKIKTTSSNYGIDIYRMGYYNGSGARKVASISPSASLPQNQPACLTNATTGLIDCGNWAVSASWTVPSTAVSGIYFAKLNRNDTGGSSHIMFIVRESDTASHHSDLVFQTSDTTWQAYNQYGGNSLYVGNPAGRAYKVSYNRPITTRDTSPEDFVFNAEYPMVRFLESNGYDVSYMSGVDTDRSGTTILTPAKHKAFLSVGHDEYWSGAQRANVEAARAAGVHLAFFSGNEVFWKTRWENSIDGSNTTYRTLVTYKETHANAVIDPLDPPTWTGTWRDARFSPPADGGRPENALTGQLFMVNSGNDTALKVPAADGKMRFWRNTSVATLAVGATATMPASTLGYEWDADVDNGFRPNGFIELSSTTKTVTGKLLDNGSTFGSGSVTHRLSLYRDPGGALVFGAGTVQWSWGLDANHDRGNTAADVRMKQATVNLFADMGAQPGTLQSGLTSASASPDVLAPTSVFTSPAGGASFVAGTTVTISGTASEAGGGQLVGVEVSTNGGATWTRATGTTSWTYSWIAAGSGSVTLKSRGYDDSGNMETPGSGRTITVGTTQTCPCTIWSGSTVPPAPLDDDDTSAVELGTKFQSEVAGYITGVRFYKNAANSGTHTGSLWTSTGTLLSTVSFSGETASGWQQANFGAAVAIDANTPYVISYHAPVGHYTGTDLFFAAAVDHPPLHALKDGAAGANGLYAYSTGSVFPTSTYHSENYWVDVVFATTPPVDTTAPTLISRLPAPGATGVDPNATLIATFSEAMNASTITTGATGTVQLRTPSNALVPSTISYNAGTHIATLTPSSPLSQATTYTATIKGGATGVKDTAGNALASDAVWTFTTINTTPPTILVITPAANATGVARTGAGITATFSENVSAASVTTATFELRDPSGIVAPATVSYNAATNTATLTPTASLAPAATYTLRIRGGASGIKDPSGNPLAVDVTTSFTTAGAPAVGASTVGHFTDASNDSATTAAVATQTTTNLVVYVQGEGGLAAYPTITDTYNNTWTPQGVQQTSSWPGFLWVFTCLHAHGGPGHAFTATKAQGFPTVLAVEVIGTNVSVANSAIGVDNVSPFATPSLSTATDALLLGAFAPGYPGSVVAITPGSGFTSIVEEPHGDSAWVVSVASRAVPAGTYNASWTLSGAVNNDPGFAVDQLVLIGTPIPDTVWPSVTGMTPTSGSVASTLSGITATFSERLDPATVTGATVELRDPGNALVAATIVYDGLTNTVRLQPATALTPSVTYVAKVVSGAAGVKDLAGNPLAADSTTTFTTTLVPMVGVSAKGRYGDDSADVALTGSVNTQAATNLVVYVHGEGGSADYPAISDTYGNTWVAQGVQRTSNWPGYLWVFTSLNAHGGPNHLFTATKANAFPTILAVEVLGTNVTLDATAIGIDNVSPFTTPALTPTTSALLLGAFAPGFPGGQVTITPGNGFTTVVEEPRGDGAWAASVASRTVAPGSYSAAWSMTGGANDFDFGVSLLAFKFGPTNAPVVGASAAARYVDSTPDFVQTGALATQSATNLVVYVHGEGGSGYPTITDTYNNIWTPQGVQQTSGWPAFFWVFTSLNAHGGPNHVITATKPDGYQTILAVEVVGANVTLAASALGVDDVSPFTTPALSPTSGSLLLGAFAPGFPGSLVSITPANGFTTIVEEPHGDGAWVASVASRTVDPGTYSAGWSMTGGADDFDFGVSLLAFRSGS